MCIRDRAAKAIEWIEGAPLHRLRGKLLPLVFLDRLLMPAAERKDLSVCDSFIAVLDADGRRFGLVVDGLADPEEIVVKPLSAVLKDIGLFSGATVLGNADLALILDCLLYTSWSYWRKKAPEPVFTSSTSASSPAASFLLRMEAPISPGLSTVPVRSRNE